MQLAAEQHPPELDRSQLARLRAYQAPVNRTATWQVLSTFGLYLATVMVMYATIDVSVWLTLLLALPAAGLIVRIFMLQHDCGHGALFESQRLNRIVGAACSLATLTPFTYWRRLHARHHGMWNNLDKRGIPADFYSDCITVAEYQALSPFRRWLYRTTHHPLLIHAVLPSVIFTVLYRLPFDTPWSCHREHLSVYLLNLSLAGIFTTLVLSFGFSSVLWVHLPSIGLAATIGIWLFSVQHRFEDAQWMRQEDWNLSQAAVHGSSYLKLPRVLQWFSGNIGFHHIHHLRPGIPNYRLQASHDECPDISGAATVLTLRQALRAPSFALWDDEKKQMVPFPSRQLLWPHLK